MKNELTDYEFWENGWKINKSLYVPSKIFFSKYIIEKYIINKSIIEMGGFPGHLLTYFKLKINSDITLLDYYIDNDYINQVEIANGIPKNSIKLINSDFFTFNSEIKYDFVFSNGFIEHFENTEDVIKRHVDLMSNNSQLLILLPNLRGLNGFVHKYLDYEVYKIHNLKSMDLSYLKNIMANYNLSDVKVEYINKPMIWISDVNNTFSRQILKKIVRNLSFFIKLFPIPSKLLSAYIVISACKKND